MTDEEFQSLKDSIEVSGVLNPITILDSQVIDGWHRYRASIELAMSCPSVEIDPEIDPRDFVKAQNESRRHLTASQRAAAIVSIYKWVPSGANQHTKGGGEPGSPPQKTNEELAAIAGVTKRTIQQAKAADKAGLIDAVKDGALTVKEAAKVATGKPVNAASKPVAKPEVEEEGAPDQDEFDSVAAAEKAEQMTMRLLLASDTPLSDMTTKYEQSLIQIERLNARIVGLQNQSTHQIKTIKSLQNKLAKLEQAA